MDLPFDKPRDIHNIYFDTEPQGNGAIIFNLMYINRGKMYLTNFSLPYGASLPEATKTYAANTGLDDIEQFVPDYSHLSSDDSGHIRLPTHEFYILSRGTIYRYRYGDRIKMHH